MTPTYVRQIALCLTLLPISVIGNAQQSSSAEQTNESSRGNITGSVLGDRGQPLVGANIIVRRMNVIGGTARQLTTNNDGNFEAKNLEPGLYSVFVTAPVYVLPPRDRDTPAPIYRPGDSVRFELIRGGVITGTVTNALNEPVISIRVRALMVRDANGIETKGLLQAVGNAMTDDRGVYRMYGLVPGTYIVEVGGPGFAGSGNTIPYDLDGPTFAPSSTRDDAMEVTVASGQENTIDVRYRAEQGHVVSGTVKNLGTNTSIVSLLPANGGWMTSSSTYQHPGDRGFAFYGVPDGVYDVLAQQSTNVPGVPAEISFSEGRRITVKGSDVSGIELVTKPLGSMTGAVALQPSTASECAGKRRPALAEIMLTAQQNSKGLESVPLPLQRTASFAAPDKDGTITFRNLVSGQYAIIPRFFARYWYLQSITHTTVGAASAKSALSNQKIDIAKNWVTVKSGDRLTGLTVTLAEGAGSVRGRLAVGEDRKAPANLNVFFVPAEREKADDVLRYFAVDVAPDQTFSADNLPPGRYWVTTHPRLPRDTPGNNLRLPDGDQQRTRLRLMAEASNKVIELKACQNVTDYQLPVVSP
jgi:carboxypeptidase family protein